MDLYNFVVIYDAINHLEKNMTNYNLLGGAVITSTVGLSLYLYSYLGLYRVQNPASRIYNVVTLYSYNLSGHFE